MTRSSLVSIFLAVCVVLLLGGLAPQPAAAMPAAGGGGIVLSDMITGITTVVSSATVQNNNFNAIIVPCPSGFVAIGGAVDLFNVFTMKVTASAPVYPGPARLLTQADGTIGAPTGWFGAAVNNSGAARVMKVAVTCAPFSKVTGLVSVITSATAGANTFNLARSNCPANTVALGGGIDEANVLTMEVTSSAPTYPSTGPGERLLSQPDGQNQAPVGWQASGLNNIVNPQLIKVAALCAPARGITSVVSSFTAGIGSFGIGQVLCPARSLATSGGVDPNNVFTSTTSQLSTFDSTGPGRLLNIPDGINSAANGFSLAQVNRDTQNMLVKIAVVCAPQPYPIYLPAVMR